MAVPIYFRIPIASALICGWFVHLTFINALCRTFPGYLKLLVPPQLKVVRVVFFLTEHYSMKAYVGVKV
jgi:hypothetical protein